MQTKDRYLIAIDLDDTVLNELFSLNVQSVWSLINAQDAGHIVMIATARPTCIALPYYRALGLHSLLSTVNGNYLYHPDDPSIPMIRHELCAEHTQQVLSAMEELSIRHAWIHNDDDLYTLDGVYPPHPYWRLLFRHSRVHTMASLPRITAGRIMAQADTQAQLEEMKKRFENVPGVIVGGGPNGFGTWNVTVMPESANKWYTVQEAARYYGIDDDHIACFGDENNDRMMVMNARHGFVMCNGNPGLITDMKALHKGVTTYPCREGGVGYEVDKLLKG